jgi:hypothetical protein
LIPSSANAFFWRNGVHNQEVAAKGHYKLKDLGNNTPKLWVPHLKQAAAFDKIKAQDIKKMDQNY